MYEMFLFNSVNSKITQTVNEEFILKYSDYSCEQLNSLWKEVGLGSYYNGLFKIIEPNDLKDIINQCYIMDDDESLLPFMCTAFGDVFAYVKNKRFGNYVVFLNIRYGTSLIIPDNFVAIFNKVIPNQSFLKGWFDLENYAFVKEKIGEIDFDECYGYFPTLSMGGNESIDNISIVKMIPYIDMNVQMIDVFERADKL